MPLAVVAQDEVVERPVPSLGEHDVEVAVAVDVTHAHARRRLAGRLEQEFAIEPSERRTLSERRRRRQDDEEEQPQGQAHTGSLPRNRPARQCGRARVGISAGARWYLCAMRRFSTSMTACWLVACSVLAAQQWPQFRGPQGSGVADDQRPPVSWNVEAGRGVVWKTPIPGLGHSSPVVWGDLLFLTTAISSDPKSVFEPVLKGAQDFRSDTARHQWRVYALDRATGKIVWDRLAHEGVPRIPRHPHNSYASATPATDGRHVVVLFGSEGIYCYDFKGDLVWKKDLGVIHAGKHNNPEYTWGTASSPVLYKGMVIVLCDSLDNGYLSASTRPRGGKWRTKRDANPSWSTPAIYEGAGRAELVINAAPSFKATIRRTARNCGALAPAQRTPHPRRSSARGSFS